MHRIAIKERIEHWRFARCKCGLVFAQSPSGKVYWLHDRRPTRLIGGEAALTEAMTTHCQVHDPAGARAIKQRRARSSQANHLPVGMLLRGSHLAEERL
jgi:hypothetical protein